MVHCFFLSRYTLNVMQNRLCFDLFAAIHSVADVLYCPWRSAVDVMREEKGKSMDNEHLKIMCSRSKMRTRYHISSQRPAEEISHTITAAGGGYLQ